MKRNVGSIIGGVLLILAGVALLADRMGWVYFNLLTPITWAYIFAGLGLLFLLTYFLSGIRQWGWLFPALILGATALTIWLAILGETRSYIGSPILLAVAVPFFVGYTVDRKAWGLLIPASIMTLLAVVTFMADMVNGEWIGALFLFGVAVAFLIVYLQNHKHWWALIPAWVMFILGIITLISSHVNGNLIGALFLYAVALPFLVVYLTDRNRRWALIPAAIIAVVGTFPLLASLAGGDWLGMAVMLLFAAPFLFFFFRWSKHWWALIPAGVFLSIAVLVFLNIILPANQPAIEAILRGVLFLGFGLTFGILWLLRKTRPTAWAGIPAIILFVVAVAVALAGQQSNLLWAAVLLVGGIALIVFSLLRKKPEIPPEIPPEVPSETPSETPPAQSEN